MEMCPTSLAPKYTQTYPELFRIIIKSYPELWSPNLNYEAQLTIAAEIMAKLADLKYRSLAIDAYKTIFQDGFDTN